MIEELFAIQNRLVHNLPLDFKRSLYDVINWDQRMIILTGARGTGKTTMVLQHYLERYHDVKGNIRESFFSSQVSTCYSIFSSLNTDFVVREGKWDFEAEVGGRSKKRKQIKGLGNAFIFKDGIEIGRANTLPLYLVGFLY